MASNLDDAGDLEEKLASFIEELNVHLAQDLRKRPIGSWRISQVFPYTCKVRDIVCELQHCLVSVTDLLRGMACALFLPLKSSNPVYISLGTTLALEACGKWNSENCNSS